MNEFSKVRKSTKRKAVEAGIIRRVVQITGKDKSTVSRTFAGKIDTPDPAVVSALNTVLSEITAS